MGRQELLEKLIEALMDAGWCRDGFTRTDSYRTRSFAYGGGSIVTTGGRQRFEKGDIKLTIGLRTICVFQKPENPETIAGRGRLAGKNVYTFRDWDMRNILINKERLQDTVGLLKEINDAVSSIRANKE